MKRILSALLIVMILAAATVLPVSAAEKVTVTYDLMYDGKTYAEEFDKGTVPYVTYFTRGGYETYECYTDSSFKHRFDFSKPLEEDVTLYVRWLTEDELVYLNLYLSPDSTEAVASASCPRGEVYGQPAEPSAEDGVFAGWYYDKACTFPYNPTSRIYSDTDIYACFVSSQSEVTGYNVFDSPYADEPVVGGAVKKGKSIFIPSEPEMADDELLMGWYFNRELTDKVDFAAPITKDYIYLFPKILGEDSVYWCSIFLSADDEYAVGGGAVEKGQPIPEPESPGGDGEHSFAGWYTDRALTKKADFTSPRYVDVELFPRWEEIHYHTIVTADEIASTAKTDGCKAHLFCPECGAWFEPIAAALIEIEDHESYVIPAEGPYLKGDANGDGVVNIRDVTAIQRCLAGYDPSPFCRAAANVRGNGIVGIEDASLIQRYLAEYSDSL